MQINQIIMREFSLFFYYDIIIVVLSTVIYVLYSIYKRHQLISYVLFVWLFIFCYYIFFYLLSIRNFSDAKALFFLCLLPTFTLYHWFIPFKKNKKITKGLVLFSAIYVVVIFIIICKHYMRM